MPGPSGRLATKGWGCSGGSSAEQGASALRASATCDAHKGQGDKRECQPARRAGRARKGLSEEWGSPCSNLRRGCARGVGTRETRTMRTGSHNTSFRPQLDSWNTAGRQPPVGWPVASAATACGTGPRPAAAAARRATRRSMAATIPAGNRHVVRHTHGVLGSLDGRAARLGQAAAGAPSRVEGQGVCACIRRVNGMFKGVARAAPWAPRSSPKVVITCSHHRRRPL